MGEVYLARDLKLERLVALKILRLEPGEGHERLERFATEARAASALNHPNVAHVYGIGQAGEVCFIAMEYVEGQTLRSATLTPDEIIDAGIQAAEALDAAHSAGIIHRDIKPANLMRTGRGLVKVLDFGLAKRIQASGGFATGGVTQPGTVMGTLGYMSPEQLLGHAVDHRSDIFSLGVVLYELLSGKLPFASESYQAALAEVMGVAAGAGLAQPLQRVPKAVAEAVLKCVHRDPAQRFQSAGELGEALRAARRRETAAASPSQSGRQSRRQWIAAAGVVMAGGGFAGYRFWQDWQVPDGPVNSLAVLPFGSHGMSAEVDYLREGIAEGIMNRLSGVGGLRVMSRDASFRHGDMPAIDAGRAMSVRGVVTGTIRMLENALLVSAELVDSKSGERLWGGDFQGGAGDALQLRDTIASSIARKLQLKLAGAATGVMPARETHDARAHDLYLRGKFHTMKVTAEDVRRGLDYFQQAVDIDSDYAMAHAAMAEAYLMSADLFQPAMDLLPKARQAAAMAIQSDPELAEGYVAMGMVRAHDDLAWAEAESNLRRAIELNPHLAAAHGWLGWVLSATGRSEQGLVESRKAVELEPRSPLTRALLAANLYFARDYGGAFDEAGRALEIDPAFHLALFWRGMSMIARGWPGLVAGKLEEARKTNSAPVLLAALARAYAAAGKKEKARAALSELEQASQSQHVSPMLFASIHAALGDMDQAMEWLEKAYQSRAKLLLWAKLDPVYEGLRATPRFQDLMTKMKL